MEFQFSEAYTQIWLLGQVHPGTVHDDSSFPRANPQKLYFNNNDPILTSTLAAGIAKDTFTDYEYSCDDFRRGHV